MKILFFTPYPLKVSPSQRFRFEQYFAALTAKGFSVDVQSFLSEDIWPILYKKGFIIRKCFAFFSGFLRRFISLFRVPYYDFIFIHREMTPLGPPIFEWLIAKVFRKRIIYDFDDAIWLTDRQTESILLRITKWRSKVKFICRWSYRVSCGNEYLRNYAVHFNLNSIVNPTTVDTDLLHNPFLLPEQVKRASVVVGWTGSHSTIRYLFEIVEVLQRIEQKHPSVEFVVIADKTIELPLKSVSFISWRRETEAQDLAIFDIGIMPLPDDEWAKGKCGFKAIQYLSLNIPTLASDVGVNSSIVDHAKNGFLCKTADDWYEYLDLLLNDESLRVRLGANGRQKIINNYSVASNSSNFLSLFE